MSEQIPTIGRIVHYALSDQDVEAINRRRHHGLAALPEHVRNADGGQVHVGNEVREGDIFPAIIVRTWGAQPDSAVQLQVFLDGNDGIWAPSAVLGEGPRTYAWPSRT